MKVFCDTNVLIAAFQDEHPHYHAARPVIERVTAGKDVGFVAAHSLAEAYSVLTRLPSRRLAPVTVWQVITENVVKHFTVVTLSARDYTETLGRAASDGVEGGRTYDVLLLAAAAKSQADRVYTFNVRHFQTLASPELSQKIAAP